MESPSFGPYQSVFGSMRETSKAQGGLKLLKPQNALAGVEVVKRSSRKSRKGLKKKSSTL